MLFIFGTVWTVSISARLEVVAGLFTRSPLEVGSWYLSGFACFSMRGARDVLFWLGFIVPFEKIALTASMAANCELQMLAGTSFSATVKNCIACGILSSAVICGCVRYLCKYSAVSVIINAFFRQLLVYIYNAGEPVLH